MFYYENQINYSFFDLPHRSINVKFFLFHRMSISSWKYHIEWYLNEYCMYLRQVHRGYGKLFAQLSHRKSEFRNVQDESSDRRKLARYYTYTYVCRISVKTIALPDVSPLANRKFLSVVGKYFSNGIIH